MQIGKKIIHLDTIDSTNNYAANLVKEGKIAHGAVILADEQTAGRGQRGTLWASNAGENLLLSLYVTPDNLSVENQVALTHFSSLSVVEFLRKIGISAHVKWPNDIYVGSKKLAGILIENTICGGNIKGSIIGIGINVNQLNFSTIQASSIQLEKKEFVSIETVLFSLISEFNAFWPLLNSGNLEQLKILYLDALYLINESAFFEDESGEFEGIIRGVSSGGQLLLEKAGVVRKYELKEIKFIGRNKS